MLKSRSKKPEPSRVKKTGKKWVNRTNDTGAQIQLNNSFYVQPKHKATGRPKSVEVGNKRILVHPNNYPLATVQLISEINPDHLCTLMIQATEVSHADILFYKAKVESLHTTPSVPSVYAQRIIDSMSAYSQALLHITEGKFQILALPPELNVGKKNQTQRIKLRTFIVPKHASLNTDVSKESKRNLIIDDEEEEPIVRESIDENTQAHTRTLRSRMTLTNLKKTVTMQFRDPKGKKTSMLEKPKNDVPTSVAFAISHIYNIEYPKQGSRELKISFYCPSTDNPVLPTNDYEIVCLTLKADTPEKALVWVKSSLTAVKTMAMMSTSFARQMIKNKANRFEEATKPNYIQRIEDFLRMAVDMWSLVRGPVSRETIDVLEELIKFLSENNGDENEIEYWKEYSSYLTVMLDRKLNDNDIDESDKIEPNTAVRQRSEGSFMVAGTKDYLDVIKDELKVVATSGNL